MYRFLLVLHGFLVEDVWISNMSYGFLVGVAWISSQVLHGFLVAVVWISNSCCMDFQ